MHSAAIFHTWEISMFLNTCSSTFIRFRRVITKTNFCQINYFLQQWAFCDIDEFYGIVAKKTSKTENQRLIETRIDRLHPSQFNLNLKRTEDNRQNRRQNRDCEISLALIKGFSLRRDISSAKGWSSFSLTPLADVGEWKLNERRESMLARAI